MYQKSKVSRPEEFHLQTLAELCVNVPAHTAPIIQPLEDIPLSSAQTFQDLL